MILARAKTIKHGLAFRFVKIEKGIILGLSGFQKCGQKAESPLLTIRHYLPWQKLLVLVDWIFQHIDICYLIYMENIFVQLRASITDEHSTEKTYFFTRRIK